MLLLQLCNQVISFEKAKLTNNEVDKTGHVSYCIPFKNNILNYWSLSISWCMPQSSKFLANFKFNAQISTTCTCSKTTTWKAYWTGNFILLVKFDKLFLRYTFKTTHWINYEKIQVLCHLLQINDLFFLLSSSN